uniref:Pericentrin/AKAP-450 centrosomal targeting domain-containing protein n=1 Tax=Neovison vison TaxID=452646 RepID=A0A8C7AUQ9_NEOVI
RSLLAEGRARGVAAGGQLAHFRQRKTKGDGAHPKKKTAKRKGPAVDAPVQEEGPVAPEGGGLLGRGDVCKDASCGDTPKGAQAAQVGVSDEQGEQNAPVPQPVPALELEALRLSLSNLHAAQLERTQATLQREKEAALTELRAALNGRHAQELALLRSRQQQEQALAREQHARERQEVELRCRQETAELKEKLQLEMEKNARMLENLKQEWEAERELCLENLRRELLAKHRLELENLQDQFKNELAEQKAESEKIFQAKNQAECALRTLETQQDAALRQLREDLQSESSRHVRDLEQRLRDQEAAKQLELESLRASYAALKAQSQEEIRRLWSQLESPGRDSQDPSAFHDQLPARTPHGEEQEHRRWDPRQRQQQREDSVPESARVRCTGPFVFAVCSKYGAFELNQSLVLFAVKCELVEGHQEELKKAKEKLELMKQESRDREAGWKVASEVLKREAEEERALALLQLREQAEAETRSLVTRFELRELEMRRLQDQQAAQIRDLEGSLLEQQGRLRQLELGLAGEECPQCGREPGGHLAPADQGGELATLRLKEDCALQLMQAQNRFLKERKEITEKFAAEQDALLREAQEKHSRELQRLQERHQRHVLSLTAELEAVRRAEQEELRASVEGEQRALAQAREAEMQAGHAAALRALEARHSSHLDSLESRHRSEVQALREQHRRALEQLSAELEKQRPHKDASRPAAPTGERGQELPPADGGFTAQTEADPGAAGVAQQVRPGSGRVSSCLGAASQVASDRGGGARWADGCVEMRAGPRAGGEHVPAPGPAESLFLQLQEKNDQILRVCDQILSLSQEVDECHSELEKLQQRRERENQEGTNLISMLKSDVDLSDRERRALRDALRRLLTLFGETLRAAVTLRSRIGERVGLCLEDEGLPDARPSGQALFAGESPLELDRTLPECAEVSSEAEISSHLCESFFMSPESSLECEQPVRKLYRSLGLAVDGLLELALDSTRQLEEARQIHSRFEKEFSCKNEETAQVVRKHQELLERLEEASAARTQLVLELHQAQGIIEGFKVEKTSLQEALGQKEAAEQGLAVELESLRQQLQRAARQKAELEEQNSALCAQKEALAAEAGEREAALRREVDGLTQEQAEARKQSEKDRAVLLSQMTVLEAELEEQQAQQEASAQQAEELRALRQQLAALDKQLRGQRHFMDVSVLDALDGRPRRSPPQLALPGHGVRARAQPRCCGPFASPCVQLEEEVKLLQEKLQEKSDGFNELAAKKELVDRQMLVQDEEIRCLEETNASCRREAAALREELERQRDSVKALQQYGPDLILTPAEREGGGDGASARGHREAAERVLPPQVPWDRSSEVEELRSIIENLRENQQRLQREKAEETERLHEVIERLQRELSLGGPAGPGAESGRPPAVPTVGPEALAAAGATGQLLVEQERRHGQALEALQQRLRAAEEAAATQLADLERCAARGEAQVRGLAAQVQAFEATLEAKEARIAERDSEIDAMKRQKLAQSAELETLLAAFSRFRLALEQQPLAAETEGEPPELRRLRARCVRLGRQLQLLHLRFLSCQGQPDGQQAPRVHLHPHCLCAEDQLENKGKLLEDCQPWKVGLLSQVKELQEKLNHLLYSVNFQNIETEDFRLQPVASPRALENSWSDCSDNGEETDKSLVDASRIEKTTCDLINLSGSQDPLIKNEMSDVPEQDQVDLQDGSPCLQAGFHGGSRDLAHPERPGPLKNALRGMDLSSWSSPEVVRKDSTLEPAPSLPLTPCSDSLSLDASLQDRTGASLQADQVELLGYLGGSAAGKASTWAASPLAADREKDVEDFIVTSLDAQEKPRTCPLGFEGKNNGSENSESIFFLFLTVKVSGNHGPSRLAFATPAGAAWPCLPPSPPCAEWHSKALLQMVCDESHHILALSERHGPPSTLSKGEPRAPLECFPREGSRLLEAVPEPPDTCLAWRGEFLQVVQEAFGREWEVLRAELQPQACAPDPGDHSSLLQRLEKVVQEQEKSLEHLRLSDRSSLLAEIQALRAQLRMTHLQNQEKLQQLCGALTSAEARGSRQEHQLRRQVELLAYKVEQEKRIASDVQKTLKEEQEKAGSARKLLAVEQTAVRDLRAELRECKQDNERLLASLSEAQKEVLRGRGLCPRLPRRSVLDGKESSLKAALQELECERGKERALRGRLEEQRLRHLREEGQSSKTLEELRSALEQQCAQSSRLRVALEHEQTAADNLRRELQIEASRCEALLAQEQGQLCELRRSLEAEKGRSRELAAALRHERLLTEQLSRGARDPPAQQAPPRRPRDERAHGPEPQARLEQMQRRAAELERDKEVRADFVVFPQQRELELQRQRGEHKIRQLQRMVQALQAKEAAGQAPEAERLQEERLGLEKVRQQLLCAAGLLTSFVSRTVDRTISDWTSSNEKAVTSLLRTLEELKSELSTPGPSQRKMTAELQTQLVDVLLKDNDSLTTALRTVTQEKAELCRAVSQLEKSLKQHLVRRSVCSRPDKSVWKQDGTGLQSSARQPDPAPPAPAAREEANSCSLQVEKLYLHYLRAESFRKALIYQKKYLLLLIGGFQDSEQETLSMIAHLGVFPSKADKKMTPSRPFTKFRTAVRVVIAILRLRFLVKKWQEVDRKGAVMLGRAPRPGGSPAKPAGSPGARWLVEAGGFSAGSAHQLRWERSTPSPDSRSERSLAASQDPERSLTEYIHHLEMVQQRLGGAPPDSASKKSCRQKIKQ